MNFCARRGISHEALKFESSRVPTEQKTQKYDSFQASQIKYKINIKPPATMMTKTIANISVILILLSATPSPVTVVVKAWSPGSLFSNFPGNLPGRIGQRRLRPVPTNLCVLAGRPRKSSSVQLPEDFDDDGKITRQQKELRAVLDSYGQQREEVATITASSTFTDDIYEKKVDIASSAPEYFSPDPLRENDKNANANNNNMYQGFESKVRNLQVPQINLPTRIAQPGVGLDHHHRAIKNLVHERILQRHPDKPQLVSAKPEWKRLEEHLKSEIDQSHLRDLLQDEHRSQNMFAEHDGVYLDYSRQRATLKTMDLLQDLAKTQKLEDRIQDMVTGKKINFTEKRAVLHTALRADRSEKIYVDDDAEANNNVVEEVHQVLDQIKFFTEGVRNGDILGYTGRRLRNIISVGIGGSYLGPEFLHEVLKTEPDGVNSALGYNLRFLANVDPIDVERTCADLDPEETLIVIVSKTFTTAETMLNARAMRQWLWDFMGNDKDVVRKHVVACASISSVDKVKEFGIDTEHYFFKFWDWVGGRYSVCSAVGAVPISLMYGFDLFEQFLKVRTLALYAVDY